MATKPPHVIALDKAKVALMTRKDSAFFTSLCFSVKHTWDEQIPTAATDGKTIFHSPAFFMSLPKGQQVTLLLHETLHVAYEHMGRLTNRKMHLWNLACDHVINLQLLDRGFEPIADWYCDPQFRGWHAEAVYKHLEKEDQSAGSPPPCERAVNWQDLRPLPPNVDIEVFSQEVKEMLVTAAIRSQQEKDRVGTIPGDIEILLQELLTPKLPWQTILRRYLQAFSKNDYSWARPNRRYMPQFYLPRLHSQAMIDLAVAVDTSSSVSDEDFQRIVSEIANVFRVVKPKKMQLIQFNTRVHTVTTIRNLTELRACIFTGRGGTNVKPVMEWAHEHQPHLLMLMTDGYFQAPEKPYVPSKTLWLIHDNENFVSPCGKAIHYTMT